MTDLAHAHGTDPDWTMREIERVEPSARDLVVRLAVQANRDNAAAQIDRHMRGSPVAGLWARCNRPLWARLVASLRHG